MSILDDENGKWVVSPSIDDDIVLYTANTYIDRDIIILQASEASFIHVYTGQGEPLDTLGENGDIYFDLGGGAE